MGPATCARCRESTLKRESDNFWTGFLTSRLAETRKHQNFASAFQITEERSNMMVTHFFFSLVWTVGATLDSASRLKFDEYFRALCDGEGSYAKQK